MDDDAGQGRRGLRAEPTPELLAALRERYGLDAAGATDLGGSANLNLRVGGVVVRVYRPYVTAARLADINRARAAIAARGVASVEVLPALGGDAWIAIDGRLVEVERYVESDGRMNSWELLEAGLPSLGRIHSVLATVVVDDAGRTPPFANHVESDEAVAWTSRATERIRRWEATPGELRLAERADELAALVGTAERDAAAGLRRQLVHGDFWDNNVLFRDGRVVLITDFDFMGERPRIDDLALTLYFANSSFAGDRTSDERIGGLRRLIDAYDGGLDEPLTAAELAALPFAVARQPLWGMKWVALLDDEATARRHAAEMTPDVESALALMRDASRWQAAFARP